VTRTQSYHIKWRKTHNSSKFVGWASRWPSWRGRPIWCRQVVIVYDI